MVKWNAPSAVVCKELLADLCMSSLILVPKSKEKLERLLLRLAVFGDERLPPPTAGRKSASIILRNELREISRHKLLRCHEATLCCVVSYIVACPKCEQSCEWKV